MVETLITMLASLLVDCGVVAELKDPRDCGVKAMLLLELGFALARP